MNKASNKIIFALLAILLVILIAFGSVLILRERTSFLGKATSTETEYSLENSYVFASPLTAKADASQKIKVTVFLLDGEGRGVANKTVSLNTDPALTITPVQPTTDNKGQAVFEVSSSTPGQYTITPKADANTLQPLTLSFN